MAPSGSLNEVAQALVFLIEREMYLSTWCCCDVSIVFVETEDFLGVLQRQRFYVILVRLCISESMSHGNRL